MDELKPSLNSQSAYMIEETEKEYMKNWHIKNKDTQLLKMTLYRDKTKERDKQKFNCDCGGKYTHNSISKHNKTKKHLDFISQ